MVLLGKFTFVDLASTYSKALRGGKGWTEKVHPMARLTGWPGWFRTIESGRADALMDTISFPYVCG